MTELGQCRAFTERSTPTARGGKRHLQCKNNATTERTVRKTTIAWTDDRVIPLCGTHAKMIDRGYYGPRLSDDGRGW